MAFNPLEGSLDTVLLHFSITVLQEQAVFEKVAVKLMVQRFCLARCSSSLRTCRGTLPLGAPEGLGEIQILTKSVLSS